MTAGPGQKSAHYEIIRRAILEKQVVTAIYDGRVRKMCPHVLGMKKAREQALFYQFGGASKRGLQPDGSEANWRCLFLDELDAVKSMPGRWHTAPNRSRPQTCVDVIDIEVDANL